MADEDYPAPHLRDFYKNARAVHGDNTEEVLRQYRAMAELCPLVVKDLEIYCYGRESTVKAGDPYATHTREGMRIAWLRLKALSELDEITLDQLEKEHDGSSSGRGSGRGNNNHRRRIEQGLERRSSGSSGSSSGTY